MADIKGFRRKYDSLLAWMARNLVYDFLDGAAAGGILSECLLDRPDFYGWDQRFVHVRTDPLLYDPKAGIAGGRMDCNQRSSSVSFPAVYPQHEIRDFLVEWNSALYHSILSGDVICVVFFPIYRYISDSVWNWCIAVYDRIGWFQLSGSAVRAYRSGGSIAHLCKEPEKIALAVGMFWSGNGGAYGQCIVSGKCDPGRGVLWIFCIQSCRNHIAIFSARHADDPAICGRKAICFRDPDFDGCLLWNLYCKMETMRFSFRLPFLFVAFLFCLWCAMFAPGIYAGVEVSGGVPNTIFQVFVLTAMAAIVYTLGWVRVKLGTERAQKEWKIWRNWIFVSVAFLCLLTAGLQKGTLKETTFFNCLSYIASGRADDYKSQMQERLEILLDDSKKDIELPEMNSDQGPFMHMEIMEDPESWTNTVMCEFYRKDRVVRVGREH